MNFKPRQTDRPKEHLLTIEQIVGKRTVNGRVEYCLKWKGRNENENVWEDADVVHCTDLIKKYEDRVYNHRLYAL